MAAQSVPAPTGNSDDKVAQFNKTSQITIAVPSRDEAGNTVLALVEAPAGSHALYSAPRQIGDWYAEFTAGQRMSAAVASDQLAAIRAAASKMIAAA